MINLTNLLIDIEDQRHYNSCSGQGLSTLLEAIWKAHTGESVEFSAAYLWIAAKMLGGRKGNAGVTIDELMNALIKYGCALEAEFPSTDANLSLEVLPPDILKKGKKRRIKEWKKVTEPEISGYLAKGLPVLVLVDMGGGHFVDVFGEREDAYLIVNSWGVAWMDKGMQWVDKSIFHKMYFTGAVITKVRPSWGVTLSKWLKGLFK